MKRIIYLPVIILFFNSCTFFRVLKIVTHEEKNESTEEVNSFLKKRGYRYDYSFENTDSTASLLKSDKYRLTDDSLRYAYIQLRVFHTKGDLYSGYSQCIGSFNKRQFIDSFPIKKNTYPFINENLTFENELDLVDIEPGIRQKVLSDSKKYKHIYVVYWNIWTGYYSKQVLKEVSKVKAKHPDEVLVILVNLIKDPIIPPNEQMSISGEN
ncbi:hypothetical protein D3C86_1489550 [compost metagenome]